MPARDLKARCWLCGEPFNAQDLTPTVLPSGLPLVVTLSDGRQTTAVAPGSDPVALCPTCLALAQPLLAYKSKTSVS